MRNLRLRRRDRSHDQLEVGVAQLNARYEEIAAGDVSEFFRALPRAEQLLVLNKWRLIGTDWKPGAVVRRPLSPEQLAETLGIGLAECLAWDSALVEAAREIRPSRHSGLSERLQGVRSGMAFHMVALEFTTVPVA